MTKYIILALLVIMLTASQCGTPKSSIPAGDPSFRRIIDEEAGVVCWYIIHSSNVSCLPLKDTKLPQ